LAHHATPSIASINRPWRSRPAISRIEAGEDRELGLKSLDLDSDDTTLDSGFEDASDGLQCGAKA
jgi:hypothetical protein